MLHNFIFRNLHPGKNGHLKGIKIIRLQGPKLDQALISLELHPFTPPRNYSPEETLVLEIRLLNQVELSIKVKFNQFAQSH